LGLGQLAVASGTRRGAAELRRRALEPERGAELLEARPRVLEPLRRESPPAGAAEGVAERQQRAGAVEREADPLEPGRARLESLDGLRQKRARAGLVEPDALGKLGKALQRLPRAFGSAERELEKAEAEPVAEHVHDVALALGASQRCAQVGASLLHAPLVRRD